MHLKAGMECKSVTQGGIVSRIVVPLIRTKIRSMGLTTIVGVVCRYQTRWKFALAEIR